MKSRIVIRREKRPRAGWAAAARKMRERDEDRLLDPPTATRFDRKEWKWGQITKWRLGRLAPNSLAAALTVLQEMFAP